MKLGFVVICILILLGGGLAFAQPTITNPPVNINIPAVGDQDIFADTFFCSISATVSIADPTIVSVNPTSGTFPSGNAQFTIVGLKAGKTVVTLTVNVSASSTCMAEVIIAPLNITVGGSSGNNTPITGLANNYSFIPAGLPNYGIAQGSIFDIFGTNLTPSNTPLQSVPLKMSLGGVTATATVNGTTTNVILYYVTPNQIAGILPSNTPVGSGTLSVFNNGTLVGSTPIQVVQSAFGILTLNGSGTGPAAAFDVNNNYVGVTNALNPGDYVVLWGTGVGPVPSGTDETVQQTPADLKNVPFSAWIGGLPATVYYHGRSQYPGLDQVILIVPQGVTPGCYVSVVTQSGNIVSNTAALAVAASGRTCNEPTLGLTADQFQAIASSNAPAVGFITIDHVILSQSGMNTTTDVGTAAFVKAPIAQVTALAQPLASLGSCVVLPASSSLMSTAIENWYSQVLPKESLNAGSLVVTGPLGSAGIPLTNGLYDAISHPLGMSFIPANGGNFTVDNGSGGPDVGKFSASTAIGTGGILTWTNESSITTVNRANGVTVNWTGAGNNTFVVVSGISTTQQAPFETADFYCSVPASAGTFAVPPYVLLALPAGGNGQIPANSLHVSQVTFGQPFIAPQLNLAIITSAVTYIDVITYQ